MIYDAIEHITQLDQPVFRNIVMTTGDTSPFDDISDEPSDWDSANTMTDFSIGSYQSTAYFNAIEYIFSQPTWTPTRFGNGQYPVWYGAVKRETTFYETIFHLKRFLWDTPKLRHQNETIKVCRSIYTVQCNAALVDLRKKVGHFPTLTASEDYSDTQKIGVKLAKQGFPGLMTLSARVQGGENVVVFNSRVLDNPEHQMDIIYEYNPTSSKAVSVKSMNGEVIDVI